MKLSKAITICQSEGIVHPVAMSARIKQLMKKRIIKFKYTHSTFLTVPNTIYRYSDKRCQHWSIALERWTESNPFKMICEGKITKKEAIALFPKAFSK